MGRPEVHSVDMKKLKALPTVADTGSVTRAAQLLHLVQSAVTRQIQSLEDQLGVALFERTRTGMLLTDAGARLVHSARNVLTELERAEADGRQDAGVARGRRSPRRPAPPAASSPPGFSTASAT